MLEAQGTMGRLETGGARFLLPTFLCAQIFIERERETSGYQAASGPFSSTSAPAF